jgi:hypothetical protein
MEKKTFGFLTEREGISQKDLKQFKDILAEFEVDFKIKDDKEDPVLEKETKEFKEKLGIELIFIYKKKNVLETMKKSNLFTDEELTLAEKDIGHFLSSYLIASKIGYEKGYRVGVIYGYPLDDVKDVIKGETKNIKGVKIEGMKGSIAWKSTNLETPEVQNKIKEIKEIFNLQKEILSK